jgi:N-acetylmuramoyl-L-alanine amidase
MKRIITWIVLLGLMAAAGINAGAVSLVVDNTPVDMRVTVYNATSYVPIRAFSQTLSPTAAVIWEDGQAVVRQPDLTVIARPGNNYIEANGRYLYINDGVLNVNGTVMVPVRSIAKAFGATVAWDGDTGTVSVKAGFEVIAPGDSYYDSEAVYWLSRIINAESEGETLKGKVAVGNVILNRVNSPEYPNSIYGVIFDARWGGQFQPVKNGTIYNAPSQASIIAAKLCLDGASVAGDSIYFLNPSRSTSFWIMQNCDFIAAIGSHQFYA